jgi:hypothetical protein
VVVSRYVYQRSVEPQSEREINLPGFILVRKDILRVVLKLQAGTSRRDAGNGVTSGAWLA